MQNSQTPREHVSKKLAGVTHILKCIADEATGSARAEIDVARGILLRVMHETREAGQRELSPGLELPESGESASRPGIDPGETATRQISLQGFANVEVDCAFVFDIVASDQFTVAITASRSLFDYINVSKSGSTLKLSHRPVRSLTTPVPEARITMPAIGKLRQGAASKGKLSGFRSQEPLDLFVSGSSVVDLDISAGDVRMEISGSSRVTGKLEANSADLVLSGAGGGNLSGHSGSLTLSAWGAADIDLTDFEVEDATVYLKGASQAIVNTSGRLDVELTGASRLDYSGHPRMGEINISGASLLTETTETV
jgi:hypothetical protein